MRILATFPGKHGDCLWSLPTVRAISETYRTPIDLMISPAIASLMSLLERQAYIGAVIVCDTWVLQETAPVSPRTPPCTALYAGRHDQIFHLGYMDWPTPDLPRAVYGRAQVEMGELAPLDLDRPWITAPYTLPPKDVCVGFTDEHFELKYGLYWLLTSAGYAGRMVNVSASPRWRTEGQQPGFDWLSAAAWLARAHVFLGCCSALHVLACAVGTPVVLMEPSEARWNPIFYPYGKTGPQVQLVLGGDGRPTWDARHVRDTVETQVRARREVTNARSVS